MKGGQWLMILDFSPAPWKRAPQTYKQDAMITLAFDTTLDVCSVAILDATAGAVMAERHQLMQRGHAEVLHTLIGAALKEAQIGFDDLERIAVTAGPGTFTGSRIGVAAARGFALTLKIPVSGISTLMALAANAIDGNARPVMAALDARRGQAYAALYSAALEELTAPVAINLDDIGTSAPDEPFTVLGSAREQISEMCSKAIVFSGEQLPRAAVWGFAAAKTTASETPPLPLYLRPPDAKPPAKSASIARATPE
ncbi:MAG: tRNA (adenosine(37)-N6)-threonylcarbamoyltransferase complex dimerization subunit type 1 TsaB [Hyphomicrobiales bacterium]